MGNSLFKVATFNANSIRSRLEQILDWLARESPDVLGIQETKVQDADFPAAPIRQAGYHVVFRGQKAHAGVAILSKEEPQQVAFGLDDDGPADEARLIRCVIRDIAVLNCYVPQGRELTSEQWPYKLAWFKRLRALLERHYTPQTPLLLLGDLNVAPEPIDIYDPVGLAEHVDFHPQARAALAQVKEWGLVDVFRLHHPGEPGHYTYYDYRARNPVERGLGWRVDHILATEPLAAKSRRAWIDVAARQAERPSDHTFLVAEFAL